MNATVTTRDLMLFRTAKPKIKITMPVRKFELKKNWLIEYTKAIIAIINLPYSKSLKIILAKKGKEDRFIANLKSVLKIINNIVFLIFNDELK